MSEGNKDTYALRQPINAAVSEMTRSLYEFSIFFLWKIGLKRLFYLISFLEHYFVLDKNRNIINKKTTVAA